VLDSIDSVHHQLRCSAGKRKQTLAAGSQKTDLLRIGVDKSLDTAVGHLVDDSLSTDDYLPVTNALNTLMRTFNGDWWLRDLSNAFPPQRPRHFSL